MKPVPLGERGAAVPALETPAGPYALVLGTAQDGGLPQIGCNEALCRRARHDAGFRRLVTSVLIADPATGERWLLDAGPDLREQVARADGHPPTRRTSAERPPLFAGVFLTHAHIGHYTGLMFLGREAYGAAAQPVYATERMTAFLRGQAPWSELLRSNHVALSELAIGRAVALTDGLEIEARLVPHRDELSDTVAFVVRGPRRKLLYLPDIDKWDKWEQRIETVIAEVDVALIDGTFYAEGEIPGRSMADIPHPFIAESLARFSALHESERRKIHFTHLNHTNPACDPDGAAARSIATAGMAVAREMQLFEL